ncbi:hypothetical protein DFJ73DRAFT_755486 [Zopfochytrium polystomum]|nr:hypothetical protein DFJ73DRAFT_755486 [Zopfochytrium polystomum]
MVSINPEVHCPHIGYHIGYSSGMCAEDNCGPAGLPEEFGVLQNVAVALRAGAAGSNATVLANGFQVEVPHVKAIDLKTKQSLKRMERPQTVSQLKILLMR